MQLKYKSKFVDQEFCTMPGWYFLYRPIKVPYQKFQEDLGQSTSPDSYMIESAPAFGKGWIGMPTPKSYSGPLQTKTLTSEFIYVDVFGPYTKLGGVYRQIMKDHPKIKEFYNVYMNVPDKANPEKNHTQIWFKLKV